MTYYIIDKKANNFNRTSGFAVSVVVIACDSFCICTLSTSTSSVFYLLHLRLLYLNELSACLYLFWLALSTYTVCIFVCCVCVWYTSVNCLLY